MTKPSIDFEYPTEAFGRIPAFNNIEEEAEFGDTHDLTEFMGVELLPVEVTVELDRRLRPAAHQESSDVDLTKRQRKNPPRY